MNCRTMRRITEGHMAKKATKAKPAKAVEKPTTKKTGRKAA